MAEEEKKLKWLDSKKVLISLFIIVIFAIVSIASILRIYFSAFSGEFSVKQEVWGAFGDFVGGTMNPILSFLGLIALLLTIILQNKELEATRVELKRSASAQAGSEAALNQQSFESTFFQLVNLHIETVKAMQVDMKGQLVKGRDSLAVLYTYKYLESDGSSPEEIYRSFYQNYGSEFAHYFMNIYQIISFVDKSAVKNKKQYINFLRAQLSNYELCLIFLNGLSKYGREKTKPLIEKYELLEHLEIDLLTIDLSRIADYEEKAFGDSQSIKDARKKFV